MVAFQVWIGLKEHMRALHISYYCKFLYILCNLSLRLVVQAQFIKEIQRMIFNLNNQCRSQAYFLDRSMNLLSTLKIRTKKVKFSQLRWFSRW